MPHNPTYDAKTNQKLDEFVSVLRDEMKFIKFSKEEYINANRLLAEKMISIDDLKDTFIRMLPIDDKPVVEDTATLLVDIVRDGLARLAADAREGMSYELFLERIKEEQKIWSDQLSIG